MSGPTLPAREVPALPPGTTTTFALAQVAPYHLLAAPMGRQVVERNLMVWRGIWPALLGGLVEPLLYLLVLGIGVGGLTEGSDALSIGYGEFVAAGLLGAASMNATVYETYNVFFKLRHDGIYEAMSATPAMPRDMAIGELIWSTSRAAIYAIGFLIVAASLGLLSSPLAIFALPIALLIGFAFGAATLAITTYMRSWNDFDLLQILIIPMFLFSATFYPLSVLPDWAQTATRFSPLYHGVAALRQVMTGQVEWSLGGHLLVLLAISWIGTRVSARRFQTLLRS